MYSNYAINHDRGGISEGGFKNVFLSKGWFSIRCRLFIRICLRSGIDGRISFAGFFFYFVERTFLG